MLLRPAEIRQRKPWRPPTDPEETGGESANFFRGRMYVGIGCRERSEEPKGGQQRAKLVADVSWRLPIGRHVRRCPTYAIVIPVAREAARPLSAFSHLRPGPTAASAPSRWRETGTLPGSA